MTNRPGKIVIATGNRGKFAEISALLTPLGIDVCPQSDLAVSEALEDGDSFVANALIKARHAARVTGLPAIADDSGLAVDALDGAPGVWSARYAGEHATDEDNVEKLLLALRDVPGAERGAGFHCAAVFVSHADDAAPLIEVGIWRGHISEARSGDGGFGYDPVFFVPDAGRCSAELTAGEKNARSHRGLAFRALRDELAERWA